MYTAVIVITGRVQNVNMRAMIQQHAQARDIRGYAKNMPDGSVEVLLQGTRKDIEKCIAWIKTSPGFSAVDTVEYESRDSRQRFGKFEIL